MNETIFQRCFKTLRQTFIFCGLFEIPEKYRVKVSTLKLFLRYSIAAFWIIFYNSLAAYISYKPVTIFYTQDSLAMTNNVLKYLTTNFACNVIVFESVINQSKINTAFGKFRDFEIICQKMGVDLSEFKRRFLKKYTIKFMFLALVTITFNGRLIYGIIVHQQWFNYWKFTLISITVCKLRHIQLLYFSELISTYLSILKKELKKMKTESKVDLHFGDSQKNLNKLETIKSGYGIIWEASNYINDSFIWSIVANFVHDFIQIACDLIWIFSGVAKNNLTGNFCMAKNPFFYIYVINLQFKKMGC